MPNVEPAAGPNGVHPDRRSSAEPSTASVPEPPDQVEVIATMGQQTERDGLQRLWDAEERIAALEEMLANARGREHELTTEAVRHRARIFEADARIFELSSVAARVTAAEDARRDAEALAQENERAAALAKAEAKAVETEIALVRARNAELESDLASIADELAAATVARTEAVRQEREENEARQRAQVERRMAAEGRLRASEATLRANEPRDRPPDAETRTPTMAGEGGGWKPSAPVEGVADESPSTALGAEDKAAAEEPEDSAPPSVSTEPPARPLWSTSDQAASVATTADPWGASASATPAVTMPSPSRTDDGEKEPEKEPDVIDLTAEGSAEAEPSSEKKPAFEERVNLDSSARSTGGWSDTWGLIRGRRKD
jgi:hypothetical protein